LVGDIDPAAVPIHRDDSIPQLHQLGRLFAREARAIEPLRSERVVHAPGTPISAVPSQLTTQSSLGRPQEAWTFESILQPHIRERPSVGVPEPPASDGPPAVEAAQRDKVTVAINEVPLAMLDSTAALAVSQALLAGVVHTADGGKNEFGLRPRRIPALDLPRSGQVAAAWLEMRLCWTPGSTGIRLARGDHEQCTNEQNPHDQAATAGNRPARNRRACYVTERWFAPM